MAGAPRSAAKITPLPRPVAAPAPREEAGKDEREAAPPHRDEKATDVAADAARPMGESLPAPDLGEGGNQYPAPAPFPPARSSRPPRP
jgi:hypothetical protein